MSVLDPSAFSDGRKSRHLPEVCETPDFLLTLDVVPPRFPFLPMGISLLAHAVAVLLIALSPIYPHSQPALPLENQRIVYYKLSEGFPDLSPSFPGEASAQTPRPKDRLKHSREVSIHRNEKDASLVIEQANVQTLKQLPQLELPNIFLKQPEMAKPATPSREQLIAEEMARFASNSQSEPVLGRKVPSSLKSEDLSRYFDSPKKMPSPLLQIPQAPLSFEASHRTINPFEYSLSSRAAPPVPLMTVPDAPNLQAQSPIPQTQLFWQIQSRQTGPTPLLKVPDMPMAQPQMLFAQTPNFWQSQAERDAPVPLMGIPEAPIAPSSLPMPQVQAAWQPAPGRISPAPLLAIPDAPADPNVVGRRIDQMAAGENQLSMEKVSAPAPLLAVPSGEISEPKLLASDISRNASGNLLVYSLNPSLPSPNLSVPKVSSSGRIQASSGNEQENSALSGLISTNSPNSLPDVYIRDRLPVPAGQEGLPIVQSPKTALPLPRMETASASIPAPAKISPQMLKLPETKSYLNVPLSTSPLASFERKGGKVYSAKIMAPNFSSRRGVWYFRFARLPREGKQKPEVPATESPDPAAEENLPLTAPSAVLQVDPRYPPEIVREKIEGIVILYAIVLKDGSVDASSVSVLQKLDPRLDSYACEALRQWKFKPCRQNGEPIDIQAEITIPFYFRPLDLARKR
jgi:TonB family protein